MLPGVDQTPHDKEAADSTWVPLVASDIFASVGTICVRLFKSHRLAELEFGTACQTVPPTTVCPLTIAGEP
jgi:hypothetical protein